MQPIHELLNRIRWDADFGDAEFALGYYDCVERRIIVIPLAQASYGHPDDPDFELIDDEGRPIHVPFHRVKQVFRNGELIWSRPTG